MSPQRALRLVPTSAVAPPLPSVEHLYETRIRRPGELHERLELDVDTLWRAEAAAQRAALPLGLTVGLLVEAALVGVDAGVIGVAQIDGELDRAAAIAKVGRGLSAAEADYLRALRRSEFSRTVPTLPVRLTGRLAAIDLEEALVADAARAARWETAALLEARTMLEWALIRIAASR